MAAGGIALGNVTAGGTIDLAADAHVYGNAKAQTTVTLAAGSFVTGLLTAPTVATLAVNTCYGSIEANSITNANIGSSVCDITVLPSAPINRFAIAPNVSPVPEPGTYALLLSGLCVMALLYNRRKKL